MKQFMIEQAKPQDAALLLDYTSFQKLCTFPAFFKINGQGIDFDLMNLQVTRKEICE